MLKLIIVFISNYVSPDEMSCFHNVFSFFLVGADPASELVRHFLIEPTPKGVRLRGCSNEPVFGM